MGAGSESVRGLPGHSDSCTAPKPEGTKEGPERSSVRAENEEREYSSFQYSLITTIGLYSTMFCMSLVSLA